MSRDKSIAQLTALAGTDLASADAFVVYDQSAGSNAWTKQITASGLATALQRVGGFSGIFSVTDAAYGAVGDGATNDYTAIAAAATAAAAVGGMLYFPPGKTYVTNSVIDLAYNVSVCIPAGAVVKAGAAMAAVFRTPLSTASRDEIIFGGGEIDCTTYADRGIHARYFAHYTIKDILIRSPLLYAVQLGEAGMPSSSYEAVLHNVRQLRTRGEVNPSSTIGLWLSHASDCRVTDCVFNGAITGIQTDTSNNTFTNCHAWSHEIDGSSNVVNWTEVCFDDNGYANTWIGCYADSPGATAARLAASVVPIGFRVRNQNSVFIAPRIYNNALYGIDNVVVGFSFDNAAPFATITGPIFKGESAAHRIKQDVSATSSASLSVFAPQYLNCVAPTLTNRTPNNLAVSATLSCTTFRVGGGTDVTGLKVYTPSITPASVAAATTAEQTFTVSGLTTADKVIVNPPSIANATGIAGARVSAADTLAIRFVNPTAGALTPTSGTYTVVAVRT